MGSVTATPAGAAPLTSAPTMASPMLPGNLGGATPALAQPNGAPAQAWLQELAPSHAPAPTGWWPLAPGWWGLLVVLLAAIAFAILWPRRPPVRLRRAALRELDQLAAHSSSDAELAHQLEHLVRRVAIARYGRASVAGLTGPRWVDFVVAHGGADWAGAVGAGLLRAAYGGTSDGTSSSERARWLSGARAFFKARK